MACQELIFKPWQCSRGSDICESNQDEYISNECSKLMPTLKCSEPYDCRESGTSLVINKDRPQRLLNPFLRVLAECFASVTFCTCQTQRNDRRNCSTFLSLIESWEDKQVSRCSLARAWEREKRELERERKRQVCGFACVSAYLTNDRKIKATPVPWQQEWRA